MEKKPTYEELVKKIRKLEYNSLKQLQKKKTLRESEATLKKILRAVPIGIGVACDRIIVKADERLCEILGYSSEEILGKSARMLYPTDEDFEYVGREKFKQIYKKGIGSVETRLQRKNGSIINVLLSSAPVDPKDLSIGVTFTVLDITIRKQSVRKLQKSEQKYRLLVESTPDWVWLCDKEGRHTFSNKAVKQILGYEVQEVLGTSAFHLMHPEDRQQVQKWFQNAKKHKRGWKGTVIRWQHKDKSIRFLETIARPVLDAKGDLTGFTGIDRDVTDRKQSEVELKKRTEDLKIQKSNLEEANTALQVLLDKRKEDKKEIEDSVITNVKEMIVPYVEKLKKSKLDEQQKAFLSIVETNLNEIISPFGRRLSSNYLNLTPTEIHVAKLIRHGISSKDISELMGLSLQTIYNHRKNIRKKLELENKKLNLRSHLLSIN